MFRRIRDLERLVKQLVLDIDNIKKWKQEEYDKTHPQVMGGRREQ